ncbi:MAG: CAP domain-containing protein [Hyphomicrobiaceae bacterium]
MANSTALTAGFANSGQPTTTAPPSRSSSRGDQVASLETPVRPQRNAKADDNIPKGTFERAPVGALADRDYSHTQLDADKARELINAYRKQKGLKPLRLNPALTEAAKAHSRDLAKWDRISHYGSDGSNPWDRVKRAGYNAKLAAENVGTGQTTIEEVMKGWQASTGHNKNLLLSDAQEMGIALVQDPRTEFKTFWTLVVGSSL